MSGEMPPGARYPMPLRVLHWSLTFLVIGQVTFILCVRRLQSLEFANTVLGWHRTLGLLILVLAVVRIALSRCWRAPPFPKPMSSRQAHVARAIHGLMLATLIALPVVGLVMAGARGDTVSILGLFDLPAVVSYDPDLSDTLLIVHALLGALLVGSIAIHLGAVGFHLLVQKRNIVKRMLPPRSQHRIVNRVPIWAQIASGSACLLALTIGVGMYAESKTLEAIKLGKALDRELLEVGDEIAGLQDTYEKLSKAPGDVERDRQLEFLSVMGRNGTAIARTTIDQATRKAAMQIASETAPAERSVPTETGGTLPPSAKLPALLGELASSHSEFVFRQRLAVERSAALGHDMILISIVPATLIGFLISILLSRNILRPIGEARSLAASIAAGNLTNERSVAGRGETAQLVQGLLSMQAALRTQMADIARLAKERQEEQLESERLRVAKEGAEKADRAKSTFLATMSHELRTPLNAIIGFSEVIKREMYGPVQNDQYRGYVGDIHSSGVHLLQLINEILDMSQLESKQLELREEEVDLAATIHACMQMVKLQAEDGKIELSVSIHDKVPRIRADERRIRQVLINLIANAVKFTPEGGRVLVSAVPNGGGVALAISDTGIGIAPEDIAKAMEPFGQIDSKLSRKYQGTGLGLPLAKRLVQLHGGTLTLESEVNVGTTITIELPPERVMLPPVNARERHKQVSLG